MNAVNSESIIAELVAEKPSRSRAFEELGLDYCCGGKRSLATACEKKGLNVDLLIKKIQVIDSAPADVELDALANASASELLDHILVAHHEYLRAHLPYIQALADRVAVRHGENNPRLVELKNVYTEFRTEMEAHMEKEEVMLFPEIRTVEATEPANRTASSSMASKITMMEHEHDNAGSALEKFAELTDNFLQNDSQCTKHRALIIGLKELVANTHQHVSKENNLLFPKAIAMESSN